MVATRRWFTVLALVAALVAAPEALSRLPARGSSASASELLSRINHAKAAYSGYAESVGNTSVPVTGDFSAVADLFGSRTDLRVWWRGATDWRVDAVNPSGEVDVHTSAQGSWRWDFERNSANFTPSTASPVRLPADQDVLPSTLGRRLLSEALPTEVSRLGGERIAGRSAAGLRLRPNDARSTIDHVDLFADPATGIVLKVAMFMTGSASAVITTTFLDFATGVPAESSIAFTPPSGATVQQGDGLDIASAADRFVQSTPPARLAGLPLNNALPKVGSVGVYGRGITELVAVPVPRRFARTLQQQLTGKPGVSTTPGGLSTAIGPLSVFVATANADRIVWVLIGTVTRATVTGAAAELAAQ